jgi:hypothetical protein
VIRNLIIGLETRLVWSSAITLIGMKVEFLERIDVARSPDVVRTPSGVEPGSGLTIAKADPGPVFEGP